MKRIKEFFQRFWQKAKPYVGYAGAFVGGVITFLFLQKKKQPSPAKELIKQQEVREDKAEQILQNTEQILDSADSKIENYFENNKKRWEEGKYE